MKKLVSLLSLALLSGPAWAADIEQYVGMDYSWGTFSPQGGSDIDLDGVRIRYGQYLIPHFGVEAHYLVGTQDGNIIPDTDAGGKLSVKHPASLFLRGDIGDTFKLYGLVGWSKSTFEVKGSPASDSKTNESDLSYGGGIEYFVSKNTAIDVSYIIYHDEEYFEFSTASLGVTHHF
jgi:opacity protein-like surface antigen